MSPNLKKNERRKEKIKKGRERKEKNGDRNVIARI
jgi:hypothetical protein